MDPKEIAEKLTERLTPGQLGIIREEKPVSKEQPKTPAAKPAEKPTPEQIGQTLEEGRTIVPLGIPVKEEQSKAEERGDMHKIADLARLIQTYANELYKFADTQDIRKTRLAAVELNGALDEILHNIDLISKEYDLHKLKA